MRDLPITQKIFATAGVMLALLLASLDQTVVGTAMPKIAAELNGLSNYAWVATGYMVALSVVVPISGKLGDMFGRKPFLMLGMLGFMAASWICGLSQNMNELIWARSVQGFFAGFLMSTVFAVLADIYPAEQRAKVVGLFSAVFGISSVIGPTLGGYITDNWSWRWVFYVNVPVGILAVLVVLIGLPYVRSKSTWREVDFLGSAVLAAGLVPLLIGLTMTTDHGWTSPQVLPPIIGGLVMLGLFFLVETRWANNPIIPFGLFKINQFATSVIITCFTGIGMFGAIFFVPLLYQEVLGVSATNSGNLLIPMMVMLILFSTISGQLIMRIPRYRFLGVLGTLAVMIGLVGLAQIGADSSALNVTLAVMVVGGGLGLTFPLTTIVVQNVLPKRFLGVATSQIQFWRTFGGTLGTAILGSVFSHEVATDISKEINGLRLPFRLPQLATKSVEGGVDPNALAQLQAHFPGPIGSMLVHAFRVGFADALHPVFTIGAILVTVAFVAGLFLKEVPLRRPDKPVDSYAARQLALVGAAALILGRRGQQAWPLLEVVATRIEGYLAVSGDEKMPYEGFLEHSHQLVGPVGGLE